MVGPAPPCAAGRPYSAGGCVRRGRTTFSVPCGRDTRSVATDGGLQTVVVAGCCPCSRIAEEVLAVNDTLETRRGTGRPGIGTMDMSHKQGSACRS